MKEQGYSYVPAAISPVYYGGLGIYIKYGKTNTNSIQIVESSPSHYWIKCPDRELFITYRGNFEYHARPLDVNYDQFITCSPFNSTFEDFNQDILMANYSNHLRSDNHDSNTRVDGNRNNSTILMSDSGGFQFYRDYEYINPKNIAKWYNNNTDWGMILDIPVIQSTPMDLVKRAAKVQKYNNEILLNYKNPNVDLINIIHGTTIDGYKRYKGIVETSKIDRICLGGMYRGTIMNSINRIVELILDGKKYKHYHILGVYNLRVLPIFIKMANSGICDFITSDSSSAVQSARTKSYYVLRNFTSGIESLKLGLNSNFSVASVNKHLPCNCCICKAIKYSDILGILPGDIPVRLISMHNMIMQKNYTRMLNDAIHQLSKDEYKSLIKLHLDRYGTDVTLSSNHIKKGKNKRSEEETLTCLDFIDEILENGLKKAQNKYSYYLSENTLLDNDPQSLMDSEVDADGNTINVDSEHYLTRFERIISNYERLRDSNDTNEGKHSKSDKNLKKKSKKSPIFNSNRKKIRKFRKNKAKVA